MRARRALVIALGTLAVTTAARAVEPAELERRYLEDVADRNYLQYARIDARADGRALTLVGKVHDDLHRAVAEIVGHNTPGVGSVKNELEVDPELPVWSPGPSENARTR